MKTTTNNPTGLVGSERYEQLYTMLLETIPSSVLLIARNLRILSANRNFLEKSQRSLSSTIGHSLEDVLPSVLLEQMDIVRRVRQVLITGRPTQGERMTYRAPGVPIRIYYYQILPFVWQGKTEEVLLLMNDVTEQVRLGEEVRRVERHLASIVEGASDLILSTDKAGKILTWNTAAEILLGYSAAEVLGRGFAEFCADDYQEEIQGILADVDTKNAFQLKECPLKTRQAAFLLISWVFSPLLDHSGQTAGVVAVGRDLTERRKFETELIQSQKMAALGVMAGGIAHEIRNPLAICSSSAQFLSDEVDMTPEFIRECAENIRRGIQRASSIIENLLRYSHPEATHQMSPVNLMALLQETLNLVAQHAKLNKVETKVSFDKAIIMVRGTATMLQQVFVNLFLNAINAMPSGGMLHVDVRSAADNVEIRVSDTGCGIRKENIQKIFDPFYTTSIVGSGTGLGLAICYSAVKQHDGTIEVASIEGEGSTFTVKLPFKKGE
jgi:PAS domain S-box-containing protein